jgi:hypothetical protein
MMITSHSPLTFHVTFFGYGLFTMNDRNTNKGAYGEHLQRRKQDSYNDI